MIEENISQKFRLKNIDEIRNYFFEEVEQNELMNRKHKKVCATLNYLEHFLILASTITGCVSISFFASFTSIGITSSAIGLKIYAIFAVSAKMKMKRYLKKKNQLRYEKLLFNYD